MKLKYYLRGIGIGMSITALLLMLGASTGKELSDEEVIARAKSLGMIENTILKDMSAETEMKEKDSEETDKTNEMKEDEQESEPESLSETEEKESVTEITQENEESESFEQTFMEQQSSDEVIEEYVIISIVSGDSSVSVSKKVFEAGLVESATEFDSFLCANGYDRSLSVGQHEVRVGAEMEEIAKTLSGR